MNLNDIYKLISEIQKTDLTCFELEQDGFRIKLERGSKPIVSNNNDFLENIIEKNNTVQIDNSKKNVNSNVVSVTSPVVGMFYTSSAPGKENFVNVGQSVKKGQVLGLIDAMKTMYEIKSPVDGVVKEVLIKNEQLVEFNENIMLIEE